MTEPQLTIDPTTPATPVIPQTNATERRNANGCVVACTGNIELDKATTILAVQTEDLEGNGAFIPSENFAEIMTAINTLLATYSRRISFIATPIVFAPEEPDNGYAYKILTTAHILGRTENVF